MCGCIPLPSWAGGNARDDAPPTRRQERERYAEELRRERGLSTDEEERRLEERLAELEAKHAEALRAGDAGRLADLEGAIADLERNSGSTPPPTPRSRARASSRAWGPSLCGNQPVRRLLNFDFHTGPSARPVPSKRRRPCARSTRARRSTR